MSICLEHSTREVAFRSAARRRALRARRWFATTGCQAFPDLRVNDALMGEEITAAGALRSGPGGAGRKRPGADAARTISASAR